MWYSRYWEASGVNLHLMEEMEHYTLDDLRRKSKIEFPSLGKASTIAETHGSQIIQLMRQYKLPWQGEIKSSEGNRNIPLARQ